jgi:TPR repeat protein
VVGVTADVEKARTWYQQAASLGSSEATRRLSLLANQ